MAFFTQAAQDVSPRGYERLKSITVRVCDGLHGGVLHHGYAPAGRLHRNGVGGTRQRNTVDA